MNIDNIDINILKSILNIDCNDIEIIKKEFNRSILNTVKLICKLNVSNEDYCIDMTIGNGNDTLALAKLAKHVFGFDIQNQAIENTKELLGKNNINNYTLYKTSHVNVAKVLSKYEHKIKLIIYNLGYLPKGDKSITTKKESTLASLINCFDLLTNDGKILMVFYPHEEGKLEYITVINYLDNNNIKYVIYRNTDKEYAPFLLVISSFLK